MFFSLLFSVLLFMRQMLFYYQQFVYFIDFSKIKLFFTLYSDGHGWKCTVCGKDLATKYSLARHIRRHVEETPQYSCEVCGLNFSWKESLNYHIRRKHHEFTKVSGFIHQEQFQKLCITFLIFYLMCYFHYYIF